MLPASDFPQLCHEADGYSLRQGKTVVRVDFDSGAVTYRRLHGGGRGEMLARAVGIRPGNRIPVVMDATAGLGRDAFVLASLGCQVFLFERATIVRTLLEDGLSRAAVSRDESVREAIGRMSLEAGDAITALSDGRSQLLPDVIYLDPMFPERRKTAAVKKEMAMFQQLLQDEPDDADDLLRAALEADPCRVVVKRPKHAPHLAGLKPSTTLEGKATRFDIYARRSLALG